MENSLIKSKIYRYVEELSLFVVLLKMRKINNFMISLRMPNKIIHRGRRNVSSLDCQTIIISNHEKVTVEHNESYSWGSRHTINEDQYQERGFSITSDGKYENYYTHMVDDDSDEYQRKVFDYDGLSEIEQIIIKQYDEKTTVCWENPMEYRISIFPDLKEGKILSNFQIKTLVDLLTPITEFDSILMNNKESFYYEEDYGSETE